MRRVHIMPDAALLTGPVQCGGDQPGVYLRAEVAARYANLCSSVAASIRDGRPTESARLECLGKVLQPAGAPQRVVLV
jgi:hypothetical protein